MAALANAASQEFLVEEAVKAVAPPRGVKLSRIYFDTDHAGDRALRCLLGIEARSAYVGAGWQLGSVCG